MNDLFDIFMFFNSIENTSGLNAKKEILDKAVKEFPIETRYIFDLVFGDSKFGISQTSFKKIIVYDKSKKYKDIGQLYFDSLKTGQETELMFDDFVKMVEKVEELSGNKLLDYLKTELNKYCNYNNKWLVRIFVKNLFFGLNLTTINKVLSDNNIKTIDKFGVQLCGKISEISENKTYPIIASVKYDGFRCIVKKENDKVTLISRQGEICNDFLPELVERFLKINENFIFDGEVISDNFNDISSRIGRKAKNINSDINIKYVAFDVLSFDNIDLRDCSQQDRSVSLSSIHQKYHDLFEQEESKIFFDRKSLEQYYNEVNERGEEGLVLKYLHSPYVEFSRDSWIKIKKFKENTFKVIDFGYGTGKYCNDINKFQVADKDNKVVSWVGSGFNDELRKECALLKEENKLIGLFVDIKYQEIARNKNDDKISLRFPTVLKLRFDKTEADKVDLLD